MLTTRRKRTIDLILGQAKIVRDTLLDIKSQTRGYCYEASCILGERLISLGLNPRLIGGAVTLSNGFNAGHFWLEYKGIIIDITGDQFNGSLSEENQIPEIVFTKARNMRIYRKFAENEFPKHHPYHGQWAALLCVSCNNPSFISVES